MNEPCYDIARFLELLHPEGVYELRSPDCPKWDGAKQTATASGWFNDHAKAAAEANVIECREVRAVYCTLNVCKPRIIGRRSNRLDFASNTTADKDIERRTNLLIDIDPTRLSDTNSTDDEMEAALELARKIKERLEGDGWPEILIGMSGNGATLIPRIDLPNDEASTLLIQKFLSALADAFDNEIVHVDRGMFNPSRITKVQGTMTRKGDDIIGQPGIPDMPQRRSWFIDMEGPRQVTPVHLIEAWAAKAHLVDEKAKGKSQGNRPSDWLDKWLTDHNVPVNDPINISNGRKWFFKELAPPCSSSPSGHGCDRGQYLIEFNDGTIIAGCHHTNCNWDWKQLRLHYEPDAYDDPMLENIDEVCDNIRKSFDKKRTQTAETVEKPVPDGQNPNNSGENNSIHQTTKKNSGKFVSFPTEVLPSPIANFIRDLARSMDCDEAIVSLPVLAVLGTAIGNSRVLKLKGTWYAPAVVWTALVAQSGAGKSAPFKYAIRPIHNRQQRLLKKHQQESAEYVKQLDLYERDLQQFKKGKLSEPPLEPLAPACERALVDDTTIEAFADRLAASPRGLLCAKDELSAWLASFTRYKNSSDEARWLEFYSAHRSTIDRVKAKQPTIIPRAFVCLTGTIQPEILRKQLTADQRASGLAARIFFAMPPKRIRKWTDFEASQEVIDAFENVVDSLFELKMPIDEHGTPKPVIVKMDQYAKGCFTSYYDRHNAEQHELEGDLFAAFSKLEESAARFALIIHCVNSVLTFSDGSEPMILDTMNAGIQICEWFKNEAKRVYAELYIEDDSDTRRVIQWLHNSKCPVTPNQVNRAFRSFTAEKAEKLMQGFVSEGTGEWIEIKHPKGGRPTRAFRFFGSVVNT